MSRWEDSTVWPYWFTAYVRGEWWVCVKRSEASRTQYVKSYGQDRLAALRGLSGVRQEWEKSA